MSKSFFFFSDIDDSKDTWSVVAKVLRKWVVRKKATPYPIWKIGMEATIEVSATHKNLIPKLLDDPKEGMVYNFQNFEEVENDDKYKVTSNPWKFNFHTYTFIEESDVVINKETYNFKSIVDIRNGSIPEAGLIDVIGFLQAFGRLTDQRRESDIIKRLNFSIADQNENLINITLWGDCVEETCAKKQEECDVVSKVTIQKCETLYGWFYDACPCDKKTEYMPNGTLRCTKCNKDVLMTIPKFKVHYKVFDHIGKCSIIFFHRTATELLGKSASKIKEDMHKESTASRQTGHTSSQSYVIEDDINTFSQLTTPQGANTKRKNLANDVPILCEDLDLAEMCTPKLSSTKPLKNINKEK
ncbi:hypothetical protein K1719_040807 [Acacia pycnantha]|nr:hypothetical protein K1719_040807 [Acacia pycnantha]